MDANEKREAPIKQIIDTAYTTVTGGPKPKNPAEFRQMLEKKYPVDVETGQVVRQAQHASGYSSAGLASAVPAQQNLINLVTTATKHMQVLDQLEEADEINDDGKKWIKLIRANLQALQQAAGEEHPSEALIEPLVKYLTDDSGELTKSIGSWTISSSQRKAQLTAWAELVVTASSQFQTAFTGYWKPGVVQDQQSEATQRLQLIGEDLRQLEGAYDQAGLSLAERNLTPVKKGKQDATVQSVLSSINRLLEMGPDLLDAGDEGLARLKTMARTSAGWVGALPDLANTMVTAARDELRDHLDSLAPPKPAPPKPAPPKPAPPKPAPPKPAPPKPTPPKPTTP